MDGNGENARKLLQGKPGDRFLQVQWSPAGDRIATLKLRSEGDLPTQLIETTSATGGVENTILSAAGLRSFCWSSDGEIVYSMEEPPPNDRDTNLWAVGLDSSGSKAIGKPRRITNWAGLSLSDLSLSADSRHLVFVNAGNRSDLYVAALNGRGGLGSPRGLTLEGRNNIPSSWTPDGQTLFFYSDRNGMWNIFRQNLHERNAQDFVVGPGEQTQPRLSPDASSILYWDQAEKRGQALAPMRLMRAPISGGAPVPVIEASYGATLRCSLGHSTCILSESDKAAGKLVFTAVDPLEGRKGELMRLESNSTRAPAWDLSPDGSTVAVVDLDEAQDNIRVARLKDGTSRLIPLRNSGHPSGITWSVDGKNWFITSSSVHGAAILRVTANGNGEVSVLWTTNSILGVPLASPDGKNLAFTISTFNSNAWVVENF